MMMMVKPTVDSPTPSDWLMPAPLDAKYFEYHSLLEEFQEVSLG